ncbi:MAG: hypothetical protein RIT81_14310 [Deltaproteobacteria bacterium]
MISTLLIATTFVCFSGAEVSASDDPGAVVALTDRLAEVPRYGAEAVSYDGHMPEAFRLFLELEASATDIELEQLLQHRSPVVRAYAVQGLARRGRSGDELLAALGGPEAYVETQIGCLGGAMTVRELAEHIVDWEQARAKLDAARPDAARPDAGSAPER